MNWLFDWILPHPRNNHHPHLLRHTGLMTVLMISLSFQVVSNIFVSSRPQILGYATNIYLQELISLTNQERQQQNLIPLKHSTVLDQAAMLKAQDMLQKDYWAHVSPDGIEPWHWFEVAGYQYQTAGENLARDFDTSSGVVSAWMASPTHKENILYRSFTEIGMAVVNGQLLGHDTTLVVQLFGTPPVPTNVAFAQPSSTPTTKPTTIVTNPPTNPENTISQITLTPSPEVPIQPETIDPTIPPRPTTKPDVDTARVLGPVIETPTPPNNWILALSVLQNIGSYAVNRLVVLTMVAALGAVYLLDSVIIRYKKIPRQNAHHLIHAGLLVLSFLGVLLGAVGNIL
jgi:uncharacterized protein YkwD